MAGTIIAIIVPVTCALIAAAIALYVKVIDARNAAEARHAASREAAYDCLLAAGDATWNYVTRDYVAQLDDEEQPKDRDVVIKQAAALFQAAIDDLKKYSRDYSSIEPALVQYYFAIWEPPQGSLDKDYENVRENLVNCQRRETGLRRTLEGSKRLTWRERRVLARKTKEVWGGIDQVLHTTDGLVLITGDGPSIFSLMMQEVERQDAMRSSREITSRRLQRWIEKGVWKASS